MKKKRKATERIGSWEHLVLTAVLTLGEDAYGVTIHERVGELAGEEVTMGAVYSTLDRLEGKGILSSWLGDPTPERGGRRKRFYRVEAFGQAVIDDTTTLARRLTNAVEQIRRIGQWRPKHGI